MSFFNDNIQPASAKGLPFVHKGLNSSLYFREHVREERIVMFYSVVEVDGDVFVGKVMDLFFVHLEPAPEFSPAV